MKIRLHKLKDDIYILELPWTGWQHDVLDLHNVCMMLCLVSQKNEYKADEQQVITWMP